MKRITPLAVLSVLPVAVQSFEGRITSQFYQGGKAESTITTSFKGSKSRMELGSGNGFVLADVAKGRFVMVMPRQKIYLSMDAASLPGQGDKAAPTPKVVRTGKTETIAGHRCEHVLMTMEGGEQMDICGATGIGFFMSAPGDPMGGGGGPGANAVPMAYRDLVATFKDGFQPLKIERVIGLKRELVMIATGVERAAVDASLFDVPSGYQELKMGDMMRGKMPRPPVRPPR